ncbi:MAG TPA: DNA methylase, partial [Bacillota bacterium]|nr:DNA methylase [Bacillota bacterium]
KKLPIVVETEGIIEIISERQNFLLFDRMVAFHVERGIAVPISSADFYAGLKQRYEERDGMYFLPEQAAEYDQKRLAAKGVGQLSLFVNDEKSAIQWLRLQLEKQPQTFQEIQPKFLQELHKSKHEKLPELLELLEENFLKDDEGKWYVPDPNKQIDIDRLRERSLLREFNSYKEGKGRLKEFRTEALRAGFKDAWSKQDYQTIVAVAKRIPDKILQEDVTLLMYYNNASIRMTGK